MWLLGSQFPCPTRALFALSISLGWGGLSEPGGALLRLPLYTNKATVKGGELIVNQAEGCVGTCHCTDALTQK